MPLCPPSYPYSEDSGQGRQYMNTRCPAWCDRVLMSPSARELILKVSARATPGPATQGRPGTSPGVRPSAQASGASATSRTFLNPRRAHVVVSALKIIAVDCVPGN